MNLQGQGSPSGRLPLLELTPPTLGCTECNILIYSPDLEPAQPEKTAIAQQILQQSDIVLSVQVLQEFYVQATHPRRSDALPHALAERLIG